MYWVLNHRSELDDSGLESERPGFYSGSPECIIISYGLFGKSQIF